MAALIRSIVRDLLPPVLLRALRRPAPAQAPTRISFHGDYPSWAAALTDAGGYDAADILRRVDAATSRVVSGASAFERDGVNFDALEPPLPLLAGLLRAAAEKHGTVRVLDFGGSLGSTYRQCRPFLAVLERIDWRVVEQPSFASRGREAYETDELRFFAAIEEASRDAVPDVVLVSGVLQYLEHPDRTLEALCALGSPYLIVDRTPLTGLPGDRLAVQQVPPSIYPASYPCWLLSRARLLATLQANWQTLATFPALDGVMEAQGVQVEFTGMVLRRHSHQPTSP